jgi:hypothetical protein
MVTKRGRVSAASLEIAPVGVLERVERVKPPRGMVDEEVEVWASVVNTEPAEWFTPSTAPLLAQYCRHVAQAQRIAELVERATSDKDLAIVDYDRLLHMQDRESRAIAMLATKMRISQQSTTNHRGNKQQKSRKLWEG